nr:ribonuclease H-like domain-containing protein [Tanacetum cinerariifolium]
MGLDDSYMQIKSSIISREFLPNVKSAYATISSEESYRVAFGSIVGSSKRNQDYPFVSNVPNRWNVLRNQSSNNGPKPSNVNNNRRNWGSRLVCENFGFNDHNIDICFKIISYPVDFGKKKPGQNVKGKNISNNSLVGSSSSSGFTDEQLATLISLIKDNYVGKNVDARVHDWHYRLDHPADPLLNVLRNTLQIENKNQTEFCEISQRVKQTREPFPLSDHTSKLGDLVHLDLGIHLRMWTKCVLTATYLINRLLSSVLNGKSPYKVTTLEDNVFSEGDLDQNLNTSTQGTPTLTRSAWHSVFPKNYNDFVVESKASKFSHWTDAMNNKMDALLRNGTWDIVDLPKDRKAIEYFPSDIKVCRLKKYLYGLKQALRQWNAKSTSALMENGFSQSKSDYFLYAKSDKGVSLALLVYVDDIIITGNSISEIDKFKVFLKYNFMIKDLRKLKYFLGI